MIMKEKIANFIKKAILFIANPRLLLCFGIAWMITNGWSYVFIGVGTFFNIPWMAAVGGAYLTFLWFPFTPEKIITIAIAIALLRVLFPNDEKTLGALRTMQQKIKDAMKVKKEKKKEKMEEKITVIVKVEDEHAADCQCEDHNHGEP